MNPQIVAALIAFGGVIIGLIVRDLFMVVYLAHKKRTDELTDKAEDKAEQRFDLVRAYADPLLDAVKSLYFRLDEIVLKKQARYLRADVPFVPFLEYKRISTLYRIAALLGWMRAIRRERSYLDPEKVERVDEDNLLGQIESALADGSHIELHRLDELLNLWRISGLNADIKTRIAYKIDGVRAEYMASNKILSAVDLSDSQQKELSKNCADVIRQLGDADISDILVDSCSRQAAVIFGIKEAYIYRDWQAAIGDFMLVEINGNLRRFAIMGYGDFEEHYLHAHESEEVSRTRRWFNRLEAIVYDLDMEKVGLFDARRQQLIKLHEGCAALMLSLEKRLKELGELAAT